MMNSINKRYKVTFTKNGRIYRVGESAEVSFPVAYDFYKRGLITPSEEMLADAKYYNVKFATKRKKVEE